MNGLSAKKIINEKVYMKKEKIHIRVYKKIKELAKLFFNKVFKSFFCDSNWKFQPIYCWITSLMLALNVIVWVMVYRLIVFKDIIPLEVILALIGNVFLWIGVYRLGKDMKGEK